MSDLDKEFIEPVPCNSCGAPVFWVRHEKTFKSAPIDAEPNHSDGNIILNYKDPRGVLTYRIENYRRTLTAYRAGKMAIYTSHFATCPDAKHWRRSRRR